MHALPVWNVDATQILSRSELAQVLADLRRRAQRLPNVQMNLAIVRLACCCGLRASEIGGLRLADIVIGVPRPHRAVRAETAKLRRPRRIPLSRDAGTLEDLTRWKTFRQSQRANAAEPFICSLQRATFGSTLNRHVLRRRFLTACRVLGWERLRALTIHHGRHTFVSHALAGGRTLVEVRAAAIGTLETLIDDGQGLGTALQRDEVSSEASHRKQRFGMRGDRKETPRRAACRLRRDRRDRTFEMEYLIAAPTICVAKPFAFTIHTYSCL